MIRVLVVGEGPHDVGTKHPTAPGWLDTFLRRFGDVEIETIGRSAIVLSPAASRRSRPLPEGHGAKALAAKLKATIEGFDVVVFMADADSPEERRWRWHHARIWDGFSRITDGPKTVSCLPMAASESWLLADAEAWRAIGLEDGSCLPRRPEEIWGKRDDPDGGHPHRFFARVCDEADVPDDRETRVALAERSDRRVLHDRAPFSFGAFWAELVAAGIAEPMTIGSSSSV
ncbi:MAG: hypothetical protein HQL40_00430 [Alphaproteobacteria bacterium]|nr:hypothetical protein [Alphaproteobacteria bacterium]